MSLTPEQIQQNWERFRSLCEKTGDRAPALAKMLDALEERLALCPASSKLDYHNAFAGGLIEHSLRVLSNATKIVKAFEWNVKKEALIIGCLFHDLGKVGDEEHDYYLPQDSDWHREKLGEVFVHNKKLQYMTVPQRGIYLMQRFGVRLEADEYLAILLNDGWVLPENKSYCLKEPPLVTVVQHADYIATKQEKEAAALVG